MKRLQKDNSKLFFKLNNKIVTGCACGSEVLQMIGSILGETLALDIMKVDLSMKKEFLAEVNIFL